MIVLWVLIGGLVLGVAATIITSLPRRVLLPLGLALPLILLAGMYLAAPENLRGSACSDCGYYLGRYWAPWVAVFLGVIALAAWVVGALFARAVTARRS